MEFWFNLSTSWEKKDSNLRCFFVGDLQSLAFAARLLSLVLRWAATLIEYITISGGHIFCWNLNFHIIFGKIIKKLSRVSSWLNPARFFRYKVSGTYLTRPQRLELWLTGLEPVVLPIIRKAQIKVTNGIRTHIRRNHNPLHCQVCHSHSILTMIRTLNF